MRTAGVRLTTANAIISIRGQRAGTAIGSSVPIVDYILQSGNGTRLVNWSCLQSRGVLFSIYAPVSRVLAWLSHTLFAMAEPGTSLQSTTRQAEGSLAYPEDSHPDANYVLQATDVERKRLEMQHKLMMALFPNGIFPKDLELRKGDKILDSGTGTGAWAVEAASVVPSGVHVYAVDIEQLLWPVHPPANTIFSVHSVQSLPSDWSSTFSFVHQRLLGGGLDLLGWQRALSEALRVLKPGGFIRIVDIRNLHLYVHLPDRVDASLRIPYTKRHQELMTLLWDSRNLLQNCGERLPTLVQEAGFEIVEVEPATISYGPLGRGSAWREDLSALLRSMKFPILQAKGFGLIHSEEEYDELIRNIELEWDENVMMLDFVAVTGRKPVGLEAP